MDIYRLSLRAIPHKRSVLAGGFLLGFAVAAALLAFSGLLMTKSRLAHHAADQVQSLGLTTSKWISTFGRLAELDEQDACSPGFVTQLRQIAFLPDGVHELLYARGNSILCSVTVGKAEQPIPIGQPDLTLNDRRIDVWIDRDLRVLGLPGVSGTFLRLGNFMMIISEPDLIAPPSVWMEQHLSYLTADREAASQGWSANQSVCEAHGIYCVDLSAPVGEIIAHEQLLITIGVLLSILCGLIAVWSLNAWLTRLWAFPTRFRRLMDQDNVICDYQPLLSFAEGRICGIEVLARWQDITGEKVYPDRFLPVVQARGLTRCFTEVLVGRVYRDLLALPDHGEPLRVHFNIFPQDFDAEWLLTLFAPLLLLSDRFTVVAEIVESDCLPLERSRETVETLRKHGILTYIDDFGAGYSNIQYLGHLAVAGVKLDRAFGQAPEGSLMAGLLSSAAEMIKGAGFPLVVEGVETEERLRFLKNCGLFEQAQGYHIARPLRFSDLVAFLREQRTRPSAVETGPLPIAI